MVEEMTIGDKTFKWDQVPQKEPILGNIQFTPYNPDPYYISLIERTPILYGWVCPVCSRVMGPAEKECVCNYYRELTMPEPEQEHKKDELVGSD